MMLVKQIVSPLYNSESFFSKESWRKKEFLWGIEIGESKNDPAFAAFEAEKRRRRFRNLEYLRTTTYLVCGKLKLNHNVRLMLIFIESHH